MKNGCCVREIHSALEREALEMRLALYAFEGNYDLLNVMALPPLAQRTYWLLKGKEHNNESAEA